MPLDHVLPPDLPDAAAAYVESMPPGRVELFSLAPLDRTGVACWNAIFLNEDGTRFHGVTPHGVGYGTTDAEAIVGTTGELAEAVHSAGAIARFPRRRRQLRRAGGGAGRAGHRRPADALPARRQPGGPRHGHGVGAGPALARRRERAGADGDRGVLGGRFHAGLPAVHHPHHQRAGRRPDAGFRHRPRHLRAAAARRQRHRVPRHGPRHRARSRRTAPPTRAPAHCWTGWRR